MSFCPCRTRERGSSLLEFTIVLGIVSAAIGALWVASGKVDDNKKIQQLQQQVTIISQNYKALFRSGPSSNASGTQITGEGINAGAFPDDMLVNDSPVGPWGGPVVVYDNANQTNPMWNSVGIEYQGLTLEQCNMVANAIIDVRETPWVNIITPATGNHIIASNTPPAPIYSMIVAGTNRYAPPANNTLQNWIRTSCDSANGNSVRVMFRMF
jgi:type II secretory pathway pseudopilin PulG